MHAHAHAHAHACVYINVCACARAVVAFARAQLQAAVDAHRRALEDKLRGNVKAKRFALEEQHQALSVHRAVLVSAAERLRAVR